MPSINCPNCGNLVEWPEGLAPPIECNNCFYDIQDLTASPPEPNPVSESTPENPANSAGNPPEGPVLQVLSQATQESFSVFPSSTPTIIGRHFVGKLVLEKVSRKISRKHCEIRYEDGHYYVTDLGSANGTFVGEHKLDCKSYPNQQLKDGQALFLGREPFVVRLIQEDPQPGRVPNAAEPNRISLKVAESAPLYECQSCFNYRSPVPEFTCPKCNNYNG